MLVDLIQQGIDTGEFRPISTIETAITISAIYEGLMLHWLIDPTVVDWDIMGEGAVQLLLEGIKQNKRDEFSARK